ncbi:MAG: DUF4337 family protein [Janthinobacterium lividum]
MDNVEMAQDSMEHAHGHAAHAAGGPPTSTRVAAVLVAVLAAVAVVVEMSGNDQQTMYLANDVAASDLWSQYQGKSVRHTVMLQTADILESQAAFLSTESRQTATQAPTPAQSAKAQLDAKIAASRVAAARLEDEPGHDGMRQLAARAQHEEHGRDHALHLHEGFERSVRALQIAIVLVGLFMATRLFWLLGVGATLGGVGLLYGIAVGFGIA